MSKIRKGSIVWDTFTKKKTKVLTTPGKGELPDRIFSLTGNKYAEEFKEVILLAFLDDEPYSLLACNNKPCYMGRVHNLIPYSEYLEIQEQLKIKYN